MAERKIFAGHAVRRLRRLRALTQAAMAEQLSISPSYLNLVERNQRPLSAALMLRLADAFDVDPRALAADPPGGGAGGLRRRLADPLFEGIEVDRTELDEWIAAAPAGAAAFARAYDAIGGAVSHDAPRVADPLALVGAEIARWRNHFADLDAAAEGLAEELRLGHADLDAALVERLRTRHALSVRTLPVDAMPDRLARLDLHARQVQLSEALDPAARRMELARQLAGIEAAAAVDALAAGVGLGERSADRLYRRHLMSYWAAALAMPYARFLRACEATGYDLPLLARRFGVGVEPVAHRLTTLGRVGARGLPFFLLRIDPAGQVSKRFAGLSGAALAEASGRCPLWRVDAAFARPGAVVAQLVALEDGGLWFTLATAVDRGQPQAGATPAQFAVILGIDAALAGDLAAARGIALSASAATPIGLGCRVCLRPACPQRSHPPAGRPLTTDRIERGVSPFSFPTT